MNEVGPMVGIERRAPGTRSDRAAPVCDRARLTHTGAHRPCVPVLRTGGHTGKAHTYLTRCKFRNWKVPLLHSPIQDTEPESSSRKLVGALHAIVPRFGVRWSCGTVGRKRERRGREKKRRSVKGGPSFAVEKRRRSWRVPPVVESVNLSEAIGERRRTPEEEGIKEDAGGKEKSTRKRRR